MTDALDLQLNSEEAKVFATAPILVFLLIAAADGKIDKKEVKQFEKILIKKEYQAIRAMMQMADVSVNDYIQAFLSAKVDYIHELQKITAALDENLSKEQAAAIKLILLSLGKVIAESSGGFLGIFGSKISKEEKIALSLIAQIFGFFGEDTNSEPTNGDRLCELPENVYPLLKPYDWGIKSKEQVYINNVYGNEEIIPDEPVVAFAIDGDHSVSFVNREQLSDAVSAEMLREQAFKNLDARLTQECEWQELNVKIDDTPEGTVYGLVLIGDYYCAEAMLSKTLLAKAHELLDSAFMMVAAPERGKCFVVSSNGIEQPEPLKLCYMQNAIKGYFNPDQAPIAPTLWLVCNGKVIGHASGMESAIEEVKELAENKLAQENEKLVYDAQILGDAQSYDVLLQVAVKDVQVMLKIIQHGIRNVALHHGEQPGFTGALEVQINIEDPQYEAAMEPALREEIDSLFEYLTQQVQEIFEGNSFNKKVSLTYNL
ncbi:MAG: hypothetical protein PVI97_08535 [Candidatus Thiodiazotropha sp.]|jgi:hypothetical protein